VTITVPLRDSAAPTAAVISSWRSATVARRVTVMPCAASIRPACAALVSTVSPSSSSVPTATISRERVTRS